MLVFMWIAWFLFAPSYQISDPNCLRAYPEALDGVFELYNRFEDEWDVTKEDVVQHTTLFSTRFKRAHELFALGSDNMEFIVDAVSRSSSPSKKNTQFYFKLKNNVKGLKALKKFYRKGYETLRKINSNSNNEVPVVGLYMEDLHNSFSLELKALKLVFGSKQNSTFPIGKLTYSCLEYFKIESGVKLLQRLDFLTCSLDVTNKSSPEESADDIVTSCSNLRDMAININITAEFHCLFLYPSYGTTDEGVVGSLENFQRFWCRVVEIVTKNKSLPQIILSAFDVTPVDYKGNETILWEDPYYHYGWWKRRHTTSYEPSAFVEKVEELPGGREPGDCTAQCSFCRSSKECCEERKCFVDTSFQPLETGPPPRVCQSINTSCAPRPPNLTASRTLVTNPNGTSIISNTSSFADNVTITILSAAIFILGVAAVLIYRRRKRREILTKQELQDFYEGSVVSTRVPFSHNHVFHELADDLPYDKSMEINELQFEIYENKLLGCGEFGIVMQGLIGDKETAVKSLRTGTSKLYLKALLQELKILSYLGRHENIVNLLGAHTAKVNSGKLYLFLEICPGGNLLQFLRSHRYHFSDARAPETLPLEGEEKRLTCKDLLQWSLQIASAMGHLSEKKVIHGDIAARNILVFSRDQVKLTDFGLSRRLYEHSNYVKKNQEPLPWRHMSLEALRDLSFSVESDVWSFGVTLWEIFSIGEVPYPGQSCTQDFIQLLVGGLRPICPRHAHPLIYEVMTSCWTSDVQLRPDITQIHANLSSALDEFYSKQHYILPSDISLL